MKKGISIPIEFIIILALAIVTLAAIMLFFSFSQRSGGAGISSSYATANCRNECVKDQEMLSFSLTSWKKKVGSVFVDTNICNNTELKTMAFCGSEQSIEGKSIPCYDITTCRVRDSYGKECSYNKTTCTGEW